MKLALLPCVAIAVMVAGCRRRRRCIADRVDAGRRTDRSTAVEHGLGDRIRRVGAGDRDVVRRVDVGRVRVSEASDTTVPPAYVDVDVGPGLGTDGFVGARDDVELDRCELDGDHWVAAGTRDEHVGRRRRLSDLRRVQPARFGHRARARAGRLPRSPRATASRGRQSRGSPIPTSSASSASSASPADRTPDLSASDGATGNLKQTEPLVGGPVHASGSSGSSSRWVRRKRSNSAPRSSADGIAASARRSYSCSSMRT